MASIPASTLRHQDGLQRELMEAILRDDADSIDALVKRGAPLYPHYHHPDFADPDLEPHVRDAAVVNPVDWAALANRPRAAMQLLELGSCMRGGSEVRPRPQDLPEVGLAASTQVAVNKAAQHGHLGLLKMLIERGASPAQKNNKGYTALHVAVGVGKADVTTYLLQHRAWELEEKRAQVLELAEQRGLAVIFAEVLSLGGGVAEFEGSTLCEKANLSGTARLQTPSTRPSTQSSPRTGTTDRSSKGARGIGGGAQEQTKRLDLHMTGGFASWGWSPHQSLPNSPMAAASGGASALSKPVLSVVVSHELSCSDVRLRGELQCAIRKGDISRLRGLLGRGAPLEALFDLGYGSKGNCIDWACACSKPEVALLLLETADQRGIGDHLAVEAHSAFFWSVSQGYPQVLEALLGRGAEVGRLSPAKNHDEHETALRVAAVGSRTEEMAVLFKYGAWDWETDESRARLLGLASRRRLVAEAFREAGIGSFDEQLAPLDLAFKDHGIWTSDYPREAPVHWEQEFKGTENGGS